MKGAGLNIKLLLPKLKKAVPGSLVFLHAEIENCAPVLGGVRMVRYGKPHGFELLQQFHERRRQHGAVCVYLDHASG